MEGVWYVETGQRVSFSEQQLMDCAWDYGPRACDGGDARPAMNFIAKTGGIAIEQDYSYRSSVDYCRSGNHTRMGMFKGFLEIEARDEKALMEAVFRLGPISVAVDASLDSFGFYKEGVYSDDKCSRWNLDHQVMLFGYGTDPLTGLDYWLVKNSWSKLYGIDGYIRIKRGDGDCGIATEGSVAVIEDDHKMEGRDIRILEAVKRW